jgi:16S rRNA (cytosine967-C5)-methyltransferase
VADLCAAPGGKTLGLAATAGTVVACDRTFRRTARLRENVARLALPGLGVVVADARAPALSADVVLADVPCTGTGTLARHPDARWRLGPTDIGALAGLQRAILGGAARAVRRGGLLVYATCSLEREENEDQVESFLEAHPEFDLEPGPAVRPEFLDDVGRLSMTPHAHGVDGAFAARMRRR